MSHPQRGLNPEATEHQARQAAYNARLNARRNRTINTEPPYPLRLEASTFPNSTLDETRLVMNVRQLGAELAMAERASNQTPLPGPPGFHRQAFSLPFRPAPNTFRPHLAAHQISLVQQAASARNVPPSIPQPTWGHAAQGALGTSAQRWATLPRNYRPLNPPVAASHPAQTIGGAPAHQAAYDGYCQPFVPPAVRGIEIQIRDVFDNMRALERWNEALQARVPATAGSSATEHTADGSGNLASDRLNHIEALEARVRRQDMELERLRRSSRLSRQFFGRFRRRGSQDDGSILDDMDNSGESSEEEGADLDQNGAAEEEEDVASDRCVAEGGQPDGGNEASSENTSAHGAVDHSF